MGRHEIGVILSWLFSTFARVARGSARSGVILSWLFFQLFARVARGSARSGGDFELAFFFNFLLELHVGRHEVGVILSWLFFNFLLELHVGRHEVGVILSWLFFQLFVQVVLHRAVATQARVGKPARATAFLLSHLSRHRFFTHQFCASTHAWRQNFLHIFLLSVKAHALTLKFANRLY